MTDNHWEDPINAWDFANDGDWQEKIDAATDVLERMIAKKGEDDEGDEGGPNAAANGPDPTRPSPNQPPAPTPAERVYWPFLFPNTFANYDAWEAVPERIQREYRDLIERGFAFPGPRPDDTDDPNDDGFPNRPHSQVYWVRELFYAILNIRDHKDERRKPQTKESVEQPAAPVVMIMEQRGYTAADIEYICWDMFCQCQLREFGINLVEEYKGGHAENYHSFEDRMQAIINACRDYKTVCKLLLDVPYSKRLANAPTYERIIANARSTRNERLRRLVEAAIAASKRMSGDLGLGALSINDPADKAFVASGSPFPADDAPFKRRICNILSVSEDFAHVYTLDQLRTYAFAYNRDVVNAGWTVAGCDTQYGHGYRWLQVDDDALHSDHFAQALPEYRDLAVARNDLSADGELTNSPHRNGFRVQGVEAYEQALGMVDNPYGLFVPRK